MRADEDTRLGIGSRVLEFYTRRVEYQQEKEGEKILLTIAPAVPEPRCSTSPHQNCW